MGFAGLVMQWIKPSRWWRREKTIQITVWPRFLAQALCPHIHKSPIMWGENKTITYLCIDCRRHIEEKNDCAHGEVSLTAWEELEGQKIPHTFRCQHCGQPLEPFEVPKSASVLAQQER